MSEHRFVSRQPGVEHGPAFRGIAALWRAGDEALALVDVRASADDDAAHFLHPVVLEARDGERTDLDLLSESGESLAAVEGLRLRALGPAELSAAVQSEQPPAAPAELEPSDGEEVLRLALHEPEAARRLLLDTLLERVSVLLGLSPADREAVRPRFDQTRLGLLGIDSLGMARLRDRFRVDLSVDVPPQRLLGDATAGDIVDLICRQLVAASLVIAADDPSPVDDGAEVLIL
jgi:hypothetical protein